MPSVVSGTCQVSLNIWWVNEPAAKPAIQLGSGSCARSEAPRWSRRSYSSLFGPHSQPLCALTHTHPRQPACMQCGPPASSSSIAQNQARNANLPAPLQTSGTEALRTGTGSRGQVTSMLTKVWELLPRVLFLFAYFQKTTYMSHPGVLAEQAVWPLLQF